jgi:hypothetical protein
MVDIITNRRRDGVPMPDGFHRQNHSEGGQTD